MQAPVGSQKKKKDKKKKKRKKKSGERSAATGMHIAFRLTPAQPHSGKKYVLEHETFPRGGKNM